MATQSTLVLVKPDAVRRGLTGEVLTRIERKGLRIDELKMMRVSKALARKHYAEHEDKPFFGSLLEFITSGPVVAAIVEGPRGRRVSADRRRNRPSGEGRTRHNPR